MRVHFRAPAAAIGHGLISESDWGKLTFQVPRNVPCNGSNADRLVQKRKTPIRKRASRRLVCRSVGYLFEAGLRIIQARLVVDLRVVSIWQVSMDSSPWSRDGRLGCGRSSPPGICPTIRRPLSIDVSAKSQVLTSFSA